MFSEKGKEPHRYYLCYFSSLLEMKDCDIRHLLGETYLRGYLQDSASIVVEEFSIMNGDSRVDIAVVNSVLHGIEIKSQYDSLQRLPRQCEFYNQIFDLVTIVCAPNHLKDVQSIVPSWWEILLVDSENREIILFRAGARNAAVCSQSLVRLLWRDEVLQALKEFDLDRGFRSKPCNVLWNRLATELPLGDLNELVRSVLKSRTCWQSGGRHALCGG